MMCNEQCFSLATENLLGIEVPPRAKFIRGKGGCVSVSVWVLVCQCVGVYMLCVHVCTLL